MTNDEIIIDANKLNKSFAGKPAVVDLSLQVKRGQIFGFLGPNGSGKTTTLRMLCGLLKPDSGEGHCLGFDIRTQAAQIKLQSGYMTQQFSLYGDLTVAENLDFMAHIYNLSNRKQRVEKIIAEFNLTDRRDQITATLSGGWKQRLALAAALIHEPKLLLLDEPTAGVDPQARREFWDHLHELSTRGITMLVSTHYTDEAERCHRLVYISYGHLIAQGTANEMIEQAHLTTWAVSGENLSVLAEQLKKLPAIDQVAFFGEILHVSGHDPDTLEHSIAPFKHDTKYQWQIIPTSLEEAFISLGKMRATKNES